MNCGVYRSENMPETFLYISKDVSFTDLPEDLQHVFGEPSFVMSLELDASRKLARVDVLKVILELRKNGYFLQLPPKTPTEDQITKLLSK
jgi:uncharacterized protein YcgL (UPF0745 family)